MKSKAEKKQVIDLLSDGFNNAVSVVVANYQGLKAGEMDQLRKSLRDNDVDFYVIKNSLIKIAAKSTKMEGLIPLFKGPTSIALSKEDEVAPAKWLYEFGKEHKALELLGGFSTGKQLTLEEVVSLAQLPSLDGMRSRLLSVLNGVPSKFVRLINALKEKTENE